MKAESSQTLRNAVLESLEDRRHLSTTSYANDVMTLQGDKNQANEFTLKQVSYNYLLGFVNFNGQVAPSNQVQEVDLAGGTQGDTINVESSVKINIRLVGSHGVDVLNEGGQSTTVPADATMILASGQIIEGTQALPPVSIPTPTPMPMAPGVVQMDTHSSGIAITGDWTSSTYASGFVGQDYLHDGDSGEGEKSIQYTPTLPAAGQYQVLALWTSGSNRATNVPIDITGADGTTTVNVNQQQNGGAWVSLGTFNFNATGGSVTIRTDGANGYVIANGIRFVAVTQPAKASTPVSVPASTPAPTPTPSVTPTTPAPASTPSVANTLLANITLTSSDDIIAGQAIQAQATNSTLGSATAINSQFEWDFGDPGARYNTLPGFNAAHIYDTPGEYTITLTITDPYGNQSTATVGVTVEADNRRTIYVAEDGSDSNNGLSPSSPVQSIARVNQLLASNTRVLFRDGDVFDTTVGINIPSMHDVMIGSYGVGDQPVLMYNGPRNQTCMIAMPNSSNVVVQGLTFDSIFNQDTSFTGVPYAVDASGSNIVVRGCQFLNVGYAVDGEAQPTNLVVQDNIAPLTTGLRGYFVYGLGSDYVILGNTVANSTTQSLVRIEGVNRILIADNNFSDIPKGSIVLHQGTYAYVYDNTVPVGSVGAGPLNNGLGDLGTAAQMNWVVFDSNKFDANFELDPGVSHVMVRNNVLNGSTGLWIIGQISSTNRIVSDVTIENNTSITTSQYGRFLELTGRASGISVLDNLFVAPNLIYGSNEAYDIFVNDTSLASFTTIKGNVWPVDSHGLLWADGGTFYVGTNPSVQGDNITPAAWAKTGVASGDVYKNIVLQGTYGLTVNGMFVGSNMAA